MFDRSASSNQFFIETKLGIVTRTGDWFHTTSEQIEMFVPGLLEKVSLESLVKEALAWVKSPGSLSLVLLYALLFLVNPWLAGLTSLAFHWFWHHYKSGLVVRGAGTFLRLINSDAFLFLVAFVALSLLGYSKEYVAVGIGIVFFFAMKPGFLRKGWEKMHKSAPDELSINDRVLKMVIIKRALYENVPPADVQKMDEQLKELAMNRKKGKK